MISKQHFAKKLSTK